MGYTALSQTQPGCATRPHCRRQVTVTTQTTRSHDPVPPPGRTTIVTGMADNTIRNKRRMKNDLRYNLPRHDILHVETALRETGTRSRTYIRIRTNQDHRKQHKQGYSQDARTAYQPLITIGWHASSQPPENHKGVLLP